MESVEKQIKEHLEKGQRAPESSGPDQGPMSTKVALVLALLLSSCSTPPKVLYMHVHDGKGKHTVYCEYENCGRYSSYECVGYDLP
jgi:hypothetical protein